MRQKDIPLEHLLPIAHSQSFDVVHRRWGSTSSFSRFLATFRGEVLLGLFSAMWVYAIQFFIVMFLFRELAAFLSDPSSVLGWGIGLCVALLVASILQNFLFATTWAENVKLAVKAKSGFSACVVTKAAQLKQPSDALVVNLLSNDR